MEPLIVLAVPFVLLWLLFIRPQQRRVRAHQALVASVQVGDDVVLSAGIHGRIVELGPETLRLEVAPGVELTVARQAVLRLVEDAIDGSAATDDDVTAADHAAEAAADGDVTDGDVADDMTGDLAEGRGGPPSDPITTTDEQPADDEPNV